MAVPQVSIVDAFTDVPFAGNPAGVVLLDAMPADDWMAAVARELKVSNTAFVVPASTADADYLLRWFTPTTEVDLCGHATLASGSCLLTGTGPRSVRFSTRSGVLTVRRTDDGALEMDFPANPPTEEAVPTGLEKALGTAVSWAGRGANDQLLALVEDETTVRALDVDIDGIAAIEAHGLMVTAAADAGAAYDFVSRMFAPRAGIPEDPVTGSAHTVLGPYWAQRLGRNPLVGLQASARPGRVGVTVRGDRVLLAGTAVTILTGEFSAAAGG